MIIRNPVAASEFAISSGHELASRAGVDILEAGGNAVDAGVAAGLVLGVVHSDLVNIAGVAPIILRMADTGRVVTIDGLGTWPQAASSAFFETHHGGEIPQGLLRTVIPAAPAAWITALHDFGTLSFADVARAAIAHARQGFEVYPLFAEIVASNEANYRQYAANAQIYLPDGSAPKVGDRFVQSDLADSLQYMVDQESVCAGSREARLMAAYHAFYRGDIAATICRYHARNDGFLTLDDMADFRVRYEEPVNVRFSETDFYCCGAWCQGVSLAQTLAMLDANQLRTLAPNSADYIHYLTEVYKLVFADREQYVADPAVIDVPVSELLQQSYLQQRLALIDSQVAFPGMPVAGDPRQNKPQLDDSSHANLVSQRADQDAHSLAHDSRRARLQNDLDTSHVGVIDRHGNMFAATPSDTSSDTEVIPGTGLCPSSRGSQSRGTASHINAVAAGKRPRLTPNPALALRDGHPFMTLGTPGGDVQIQAMTQVVVNMLCHQLDVQAAIEAPRFATYSFPSSFAPNQYSPGLLMLEKGIATQVGDALQGKGHQVEWWPEHSWKAGAVCAVVVNDNSKDFSLNAGADPRRANTALGKPQ